jgi:pilus assembly protein Flp/PilA
MIALVQRFWADETGATAIEYGLIAAGISLAIIAVVNGIGSHLNTKFSSIAEITRQSMTDPDTLRSQIERAERVAASVTSETERIRFEAMASELRRKLQLVENARSPDQGR